MNLETWIQQELGDVVSRLESQVLAQVPHERRHERPGGGNSINWALFHIARHAELALAILTRGCVSYRGAFGLGENEYQVPGTVEAASVERFARDVFAAAGEFALTLHAGGLEAALDVDATLDDAGIPRDEFAWLYDQWVGRRAAYFVRWPLIAHATNHIGEMIATRNRLGLSPYAS